jgi:NET1-associated nuclear protein 1 (U3 small nucleolar RNA-associated protein 17)
LPTLSTVRWHYRSKLSIVKAIPHPLRETIAIFTEVLAQPDSQPSTGISVFQPASSEPVHTYSVPFRLRDVAWFTPSTPLETASFTLLGITHSWEVVLLGDEVRVPEDVGSQARDISTTPGAGRSRTLFQDIFGESAFSKLTVQENPVSQSQSLVSEMQRANNDTTRLLSAAPAYLMPPLETLYDAFISEVVHIEGLDSQLRGNIVEAGGAVRDGEDEDVDMDVGDDDKSSTGFITGARFLDRVQMDDFIELFRYHAIQGKSEDFIIKVNFVLMNN